MFPGNNYIYNGTATIIGKSNNTVYLLTAAHCLFKWNETTNKMEKAKRIEIFFDDEHF